MSGTSSFAKSDNQSHVLVTRPRELAASITMALRERGMTVTVLPAIAIQALPMHEVLAELVDSRQPDNLIDDEALLVFVSRNAVAVGLKVLERAGVSVKRSHSLVAVGPTTAQTVRDATGFDVQVPAQQYSSEGLLEMPVFASLLDKQIIIFCGESPRPLLADTLISRGARVKLVPVYRRVRPPVDDSLEISHWGNTKFNTSINNTPDVVMLTSVETASNLKAMLGSNFDVAVSAMSIVVAGRRIESACRRMGYQGPCEIADSAQDVDMIAALIRLVKPT